MDIYVSGTCLVPGQYDKRPFLLGIYILGGETNTKHIHYFYNFYDFPYAVTSSWSNFLTLYSSSNCLLLFQESASKYYI